VLSLADRYLNATTYRYTEAYFAVVVTLRRGPKSTANVSASWQKHETETVGDDGLTTVLMDRVWTVKVTDYLLGGQEVSPQPGDQFEAAEGDKWRCLAIDGKPAAELHGNGLYWDIRTKRVT